MSNRILKGRILSLFFNLNFFRMKKFTADEAVRILQTWLDSAITGGPNNFQLKLAVFDNKEVFFWLDEVVKARVKITGIRESDRDEQPNVAPKRMWLITGIAKPYSSKDYLYSFEMYYDSFVRQGCLESGRGFTKLEILK